MTEGLRRQAQARFSQAAAGYDAAARVQAQARDALFALAAGHLDLPPASRVLDAGCGTGAAATRLATRPDTALIGIDFAAPMLARCPEMLARVQGDLHALPLAGRSVDLVWSALALQWCEPAPVLAEFARVLRPGGRVALATLVTDTFAELRVAFASVDGADHTLAFRAPEQLQTQAAGLGLVERASRRCRLEAVADDLRSLLDGVRAVGAHALPGRRRGLMSRSRWQALTEAYEVNRRSDGRLVLGYDLWLVLWQWPGDGYDHGQDKE